ncbi:hypothetical protein [Nocardioides alcanivorans]|nr:hypothetical protein [Nocardioides alcanivorans]
MKHERIRKRASGGHLHSCSGCSWERWVVNERDLDPLWARHLPKEGKT